MSDFFPEPESEQEFNLYVPLKELDNLVQEKAAKIDTHMGLYNLSKDGNFEGVQDHKTMVEVYELMTELKGIIDFYQNVTETKCFDVLRRDVEIYCSAFRQEFINLREECHRTKRKEMKQGLELIRMARPSQ